MFRKALFAGVVLLPGAALAQTTYPSPTFNEVITASDAKYYGAKCDGTTDDSAALNAAATAAKNAGKALRIPNAVCYSSVALNFGALNLVGATPVMVNNPPNFGPQISCAAAIAAPCVTLGEPRPSVKAGSAVNVVFGFVGTPVAGDTALKVLGNNTILDKVLARNAWDGYWFFGGLSAHASWLYTLDIAGNHVIQDGFPELYINQARLGGTSPTGTSNAYFKFTGNDPNTFICIQCHLNAASNVPAYVWDFSGITAQPNGDYRLIDSTIDNGNLPTAVALIHTDTAATCIRCIWDGVNVYGSGNVPMFAINSTATWWQSEFINSNLFVGSFTLPHISISGLRLANLYFTHDVTIDGAVSSRANISNVSTEGNFTVQGGAWSALNIANLSVLGTYNDTAATGVVKVSGAPSTSWTPQLQFGGANVGMTATVSGFASRQSDGTVRQTFGVRLTAIGSSTGAATIAGAPYNCAPFSGYGAMDSGPIFPINLASLTGPVYGLPQATITSNIFNISQTNTTTTVQLTNANFSSVSGLGGTVTCVPP